MGIHAPESTGDDGQLIEERTAEFARLLLTLDSSDLSSAVAQGVALVADMASADRCSLILNGRDASGQLTRFDWEAPGVARVHASIDRASVRQFDWAVQRLARGEVIQINDPTDLPDEAAVEREELQARGVRSSLTLPIRRGEQILGFLVVECVQTARHWTPHQIGWLQLASELLASAVERSRTERALEHQLSVGMRIGELSRRFLELNSDRIDEGIRFCLDLCLDVSGADRTYLIAIEPRPPFIEQVWERQRPGLAPFAHRISPGARRQFRWSTTTIADGRTLRIEDPEKLPPEANAERSDMKERGVRSILCIPVHSEGALVGSLGFEYLRESRRWGGAEITQYHLIADILASARRRQRIETDLARQLVSEQRIASLSRRFTALSTGEIEATVVEGLHEAASIAGAERALLHFLDGTSQRPHVYEWRAPGIAPVPMAPQRWAVERVMRGETLRLVDVTRLPDEAAEMRRMLIERGVRSLLGIPVFFGQQLVGYIGFESLSEQRWWSDQDITLLRLLGELLTSALTRRHTEQALRESQAQLIHSQKMEAVGRLAGGIAHDFNNLLTVILGFSRALMSEFEEDHWAQEDIREIHAAAERAAGLTRQLLTFSRRQQTETGAVDLGGTVEGLEEMLRRLLGEDVDLRIEMPDGDCWVAGDTHQLEQVIVNLAVNARDAMPDGGSLTIAAEIRHLDAAEGRRLGLARAGDHVVLSVSDSGIGLDESLRDRIFEPFFTTKEPGKGTGLGLSIVYSIVEQAGGSIAVFGSPEKGTVFEIHLPLFEPKAAPETGTSSRSESPGGETVLLVEDEDAVRRLARRILEGRGYRVLEARDGVDALEVSERAREPIHLLLTDVVMPRMSGGELAMRLRAERPDTRVLFVSGYPEDRDEGVLRTPRDGRFLYKPFSAASLLDGVRAALDPDG